MSNMALDVKVFIEACEQKPSADNVHLYRSLIAEKYDLDVRDYDGKIEVIGYMQDPTADMENFRGREMLFPKRWVTIAVFDPETEVSVT